MRKPTLTKKDLADTIALLRRVVVYGPDQDRLVQLVDKYQKLIDHKEEK